MLRSRLRTLSGVLAAAAVYSMHPPPRFYIQNNEISSNQVPSLFTMAQPDVLESLDESYFAMPNLLNIPLLDRSYMASAPKIKTCKESVYKPIWSIEGKARNKRVSSPLWQKRFYKSKYSLQIIDAGGDGDCFYRSVALGLSFLGKTIDAQYLRIIASSVVAMVNPCDIPNLSVKFNEERLLTMLDVFSALEKVGEWNDKWKPSRILQQKKYKCNNGVKVDTSTPLGKALALFYELAHPGNNHWATADDLCALEDALDIGIIVLAEETGRIYNTGRDNRKKRQAYIFINSVRNVHFELIGIITEKGNFRAAFLPEEIPSIMHRIYIEDTNAPIWME